MYIKTDLSHEKDGWTSIMFAIPEKISYSAKKIVVVRFAIIKSPNGEIFKPALTKYQQKRILRYAKKLAIAHLGPGFKVGNPERPKHVISKIPGIEALDAFSYCEFPLSVIE